MVKMKMMEMVQTVNLLVVFCLQYILSVLAS